MNDRLNTEAAGLSAVIALGPRLVVIGSTSFLGVDSRELCQAIAAELATIAPLVAFTGGMDGVGLTFGKSFAAVRQATGLPENLYHLLPRGLGPCDCGVTLDAGIDFYDRREILGRVGHAYLVIEGGPGTEHERNVASGRGMPLIPLGRSGGHAGDLYAQLSCPPWASATEWALVGDTKALHSDVILAVRRLVQIALNGCAA